MSSIISWIKKWSKKFIWDWRWSKKRKSLKTFTKNKTRITRKQNEIRFEFEKTCFYKGYANSPQLDLFVAETNLKKIPARQK